MRNLSFTYLFLLEDSQKGNQRLPHFFLYNIWIWHGSILNFHKKGVFSSFLIFSNALCLSLRKFSISLVYICKSSFDVSKFLLLSMSVAGVSSSTVKLVQNQFLRQWKQLTQFFALAKLELVLPLDALFFRYISRIWTFPTAFCCRLIPF